MMAHHRKTSRSPVGARGQSTTEFLVLVLVLAPLFLALPLLGKYIDLAHASEHAARYIAFETAITGPNRPVPTEQDLAIEVRQRFFSAADTPILTPASAASNSMGERNPLWTDHRAEPMLDDPANQIEIDLQGRRNNAPATALLAGPHGLDLPAAAEHTASIRVSPRKIRDLPPFDRLGLSIRRHQILLGHNWSAAGSADLARRIERAGPLAHPIQPLAVIGRSVGRILPPLVLDKAMEVGRVRAEIVPCDRLEHGC